MAFKDKKITIKPSLGKSVQGEGRGKGTQMPGKRRRVRKDTCWTTGEDLAWKGRHTNAKQVGAGTQGQDSGGGLPIGGGGVGEGGAEVHKCQPHRLFFSH